MMGLAIVVAILGGALALVRYGSRQKPKLGWNDPPSEGESLGGYYPDRDDHHDGSDSD
jgi:hypothetical protein